jgi:CRP-like cAMP-binding protein
MSDVETKPAGTVIFKQGKASKHLYLLKKGEVRLVKDNGQRLLAVRLCRGEEILNEVEVLTNKSPEYSAIALSEVQLVKVDAGDIRQVLKLGPSWIKELLDTLCERLNHTEELILEHGLQSTELDKDFMISKQEQDKYREALEKFK